MTKNMIALADEILKLNAEREEKRKAKRKEIENLALKVDTEILGEYNLKKQALIRKYGL